MEVMAVLSIIIIAVLSIILLVFYVVNYVLPSSKLNTKPTSSPASILPDENDVMDSSLSVKKQRQNDIIANNDRGSTSIPKGCTLYLEGYGYEFSMSRLNDEDVRKMKLHADQDMDNFLSGGRLNENANVDTTDALVRQKYGLDPLNAEFRGWTDFPDEEIPTLDTENCSQVQFFGDPTPEKNVVHYMSAATGQVFGSISIPIGHPSEFDPKKLRIEYFEFSIGIPEQQNGRIIEKIEYDGSQIEVEWEDNGLEINISLHGYQFDENGNLGNHLVICNRQQGENFQFDWQVADEIFSQNNYDYEINSDQHDKKHVFVVCIDKYHFEEVFSDHGLKVANDHLNDSISALMQVSSDYLGSDTKYFVLIKGQMFETRDRFELDIEAMSNNSEEGFEAVLKDLGGDDYFQLIIVTTGTDHWDNNFLRMSADLGEFGFYVWGYYHPIDQIAVQGYQDGDFDTGIIHESEVDGHYTEIQTSTMELYGVKTSMFNLEQYKDNL